MKQIYLLPILAILTLHLSGQTVWEKHSGNPILTAGPQEWEDVKLTPGSVIFYEGEYHMWYSGGDFPSIGGDFLIGHATSEDGISWTKDENNPILDKGAAGKWDDNGVFDPSVLLMDKTFHMWFSGYSDDKTYHSIGHATSTDGVTWVRDVNNPVLNQGTSGNWDDHGIISPSVVYNGSEYHMYYHADGSSTSGVHIGHATSPDGVAWTKDPQNPVLSPGTAGNWDNGQTLYPEAEFDGSIYHMWYGGGEFLAWEIGYATSEDGSTWTKFENNPVLSKGSVDSWESALASINSVIIDSSMYKMWYRGQRPDGTGGIGFAVSDPTWTGISHFEADQISIYPNPAGDLINVQTSEIGRYVIEISSVNGQMILSSNSSGSTHQIDLSSLQKGLYFISIRSENYVSTHKIIKL